MRQNLNGPSTPDMSNLCTCGFIGEKPGCAQGFRNLPHTSANDVSVAQKIALGALK
jgi:hypothetical protein